MKIRPVKYAFDKMASAEVKLLIKWAADLSNDKSEAAIDFYQLFQYFNQASNYVNSQMLPQVKRQAEPPLPNATLSDIIGEQGLLSDFQSVEPIATLNNFLQKMVEKYRKFVEKSVTDAQTLEEKMGKLIRYIVKVFGGDRKGSIIIPSVVGKPMSNTYRLKEKPKAELLEMRPPDQITQAQNKVGGKGMTKQAEQKSIYDVLAEADHDVVTPSSRYSHIARMNSGVDEGKKINPSGFSMDSIHEGLFDQLSKETLAQEKICITDYMTDDLNLLK